MRNWLAMLSLIFIVAGCSDDSPDTGKGGSGPQGEDTDGSGFITNQRIIYSDGLTPSLTTVDSEKRTAL